jgi:hypothetical protein
LCRDDYCHCNFIIKYCKIATHPFAVKIVQRTERLDSFVSCAGAQNIDRKKLNASKRDSKNMLAWKTRDTISRFSNANLLNRRELKKIAVSENPLFI